MSGTMRARQNRKHRLMAALREGIYSRFRVLQAWPVIRSMPSCLPPIDAKPLTTPTDFPQRRSIRSYVVRAGRMGPGQTRALQDLAPRHVIAYQTALLDLVGRIRPGSAGCAGDRLRHGHRDGGDRRRPGRIPIFSASRSIPPGVGALLQQIDALRLTNLRLIQHDAVEVLEHMLPAASLAGVHIYFPDPWPKKRHHKRRLLQAGVCRPAARPPVGWRLSALRHRLAALCRADAEVLSAQPGLVNTADGFAPRPDWRPLTKFEQRGLGARPRRLGSAVHPLQLTDAGPPGAEHDQTERDPVPGKRHEAVSRDIAQQPAHAEKCRNERGHHADCPHADIVDRQQRAILVKRIQRCDRQRRDGKEKCEFGCRPVATVRTTCRR